mmetsp:Transcript_30649/g.89077  ORF Transcript_30649/g.89077 Transcript_30649/m.89077 type:complete len:634 (-) Transcript_30649:172-2073(-)
MQGGVAQAGGDSPLQGGEPEEDLCEFIVVGSGAAGSAVALSLAEQGCSVHVLEGGGAPSDICLFARGSASCVVGAPDAYERLESAVFRGCLWSGSGRCLGGGTSVNAGFLVEQRGYWEDEEGGWLSGVPEESRLAWRTRWAETDVHRCHARVEGLLGVGEKAPDTSTGTRVASGATPISSPPPPHVGFWRSFQEACERDFCGTPGEVVRSVSRGEAVGGRPRTVFAPNGGRRRTLAALLATHPRVRISTGCSVVRLLLGTRPREGDAAGRSGGVEVESSEEGDDSLLAAVGAVLATGEEVRCSRGVVVCGGSEASARLLMHSGLGPAQDLERWGIRRATALLGPGSAHLAKSWELVGSGFMDHPTCFEPLFFPVRVLPDVLPKYEGTVLDLRPGTPAIQLSLMSEQGLSGFVWLLSRPTGGTVSIFMQLLSRVILVLVRLLGWAQAHEPIACGALFGTCLEPRTRSRLLLVSRDPARQLSSTAPDLDIADREALWHAAKHCRRIADHICNANAPKGMFGRAVSFAVGLLLRFLGLTIPRDSGSDDGKASDALVRHVDARAGTLWHPMGGVPAGRVLDHHLRVPGVSNLHVCGAAALPAPVLCNPMASCYAMGWRLGELLGAAGGTMAAAEEAQ